MLDAGADVLRRDGISVGASTFRYADAFELLAQRGIKVTRGSVHERIWSSQEAWQLDVISETIRRIETIRRRVVADTVAEHVGGLPNDSVAERRHVLAEACRVGSLAFLSDVAASPEQRIFTTVVAAWKASSAELQEHRALGERLSDLQRSAVAETLRDYEELGDYLDLAPHPARNMAHADAMRAFAAASISLAHSHAIRTTHDPGIVRTMKVRCPDGQHRPWNSLGLGSWLIARGLFTYHRRPRDPIEGEAS